MTRPRSRRDLLRAGAVALVGLAGCVGGRGDDSATETATTGGPLGDTNSTAERPPAETTEARVVELVPTSVQSSFFYRTSPGSLDVAAVAGRQFAFVEVRPRTDSPPPSDFALVADDRRFWGSLAPGEVGGPNRLVERGRGYRHGDAAAGWVVFEVPDPLDAENVALVYDGRRRPVGDDYLAALRAPPADFELLEFDAPDRVAPGESFEVSAVVHNAGDGSGTFRACLDASSNQSVHRSAFAVPAGERHEWNRTLDAPGSEDVRVDVRLASAVADREVAVTVASETTGRSPNRRK